MCVAKLRVALFCAALVDARLTSTSESETAGKAPRLLDALLPLLDRADAFQVQPAAFRGTAPAAQLPKAADFARGHGLLMRDGDTRDGSGDPYEEYMRSRSSAELDQIESGYRSFKGIDQEFDGGDSGGGAVGDGNMDLEDQHNSPTLGALRGGIADFTEATMAVGRGNVHNVKSATESRTASAGANYFGRSTGLADKIIDNMSDEDLYNHKVDKVRAQQKENWFNQRAIHANNRAQGQGVVFGQNNQITPSGSTGYIAREAISSDAYRSGQQQGEISQRDLANHLADMAGKPAERLDGESWEEFWADPSEVLEVIELRTSPGGTLVHELSVRNLANVFAPYTCGFTSGSSSAFSVSPEFGTMNRASGAPVEVTVRFSPREMGFTEATLVFQTEDFKKVWKFVGST